jgi:hypothetical protein
MLKELDELRQRVLEIEKVHMDFMAHGWCVSMTADASKADQKLDCILMVTLGMERPEIQRRKQVPRKKRRTRRHPNADPSSPSALKREQKADRKKAKRSNGLSSYERRARVEYGGGRFLSCCNCTL